MGVAGLRRRIPLLIVVAGIVMACAWQSLPHFWPSLASLERLEWITYDWRMRQAVKVPGPISEQLGFVYIDDDAIDIFSEGRLGTNVQFGLYWPRQVYGRVVRELAAQGAKAVALDVLFGERRSDHPQVMTATGGIDSDIFFARELEAASNVVLAATREVVPHPTFRSAAAAIGDISTERDADGVLRRIRLFHKYRVWHPDILEQARLGNWKLEQALVSSNQLVIPRPNNRPVRIALTDDALFDPRDLREEKSRGIGRLHPAFEDVDAWHLGVVLAARELEIDLAKAEIDLGRRRIVLWSEDGQSQFIPIDREGCMLIDWNIRANDSRLTQEAFESLVAKDLQRQRGTNVQARFKDRLVVIGSVATGNELSDRGATPLDKETFLTSNHWNVANSILTRRFVRKASLPISLWVIGIAGLVSAWITARFPTLGASTAMLAAAGLYSGAACLVFVQNRLWLPMVSPIAALVCINVALMSYQAFFEQSERRRIRQIFSKIVSPDVVNVLLRAERLSLVGARRRITIMFADVRGFTEMTDLAHARAEEYVRANNLTGRAAEAYIDQQSQETLASVNTYLSAIADRVKRHEGTLDKYIGDCVMAFWGAPALNERHALGCVHAAIESQRLIAELNQDREKLNREREAYNAQRVARGELPLPMLHIMSLGIGINTGVVTVGLMGSDEHGQNFTAFGRDVNLASRLESKAGADRILIGEATYLDLLRDDPDLAASCVELQPIGVKGIRQAVKCYEVKWQHCEVVSLWQEAA
jgi:class 3 adenylate cyclase/CHASE2 domain-containing sensor protein